MTGSDIFSLFAGEGKRTNHSFRVCSVECYLPSSHTVFALCTRMKASDLRQA